ncbi:hypothetical protein ACFQ0R_08600 [Psychroflexus salinarum]|uniref:Uncharacterized protein n=1 Tax=Psychroflexus salinarum TaxID=546024 RepID=A0ABW3GPT6_9FLAO
MHQTVSVFLVIPTNKGKLLFKIMEIVSTLLLAKDDLVQKGCE